MSTVILPELHSAPCQPEGELTQVEVRGLRWDGEGRGLGKHLTTNCGWRKYGATIHLLEGLSVTVHVSLESRAITQKNTDVKMCDGAREKTCSIMWAFYLLRSSSRVHRYGADKLWRNAADRGTDQDIRSGTVIRAILVLALTGDASARQNCRLIQRPHMGLHTWDNAQVNVNIKFPPAIPTLSCCQGLMDAILNA